MQVIYPTTVVRVAGNDERLLQLMQLYLYEWSSRIYAPIGEDGRYRYPALDVWHDDESHEAVLFLSGVFPIGFALVVKNAKDVWCVKEFFILASERRRGRGSLAIELLTSLHPGRWTLTVRSENPEGLAFWKRVLGELPVAETGDDGIVRQRFSFDCPRRNPMSTLRGVESLVK